MQQSLQLKIGMIIGVIVPSVAVLSNPIQSHSNWYLIVHVAPLYTVKIATLFYSVCTRLGTIQYCTSLFCVCVYTLYICRLES
jgi:hypothetical protein